jgi:RHS repeat-associated protein
MLGMQNLSSFSQGQARFSNGFFGIYHSPFGVELKGRNLKKNNAKNYRFGFQGQEGDDQIKGDGNSVNYSFRMHDPRLGRFFAVDPLASKYPYNSVYAFSENVVISHIELEGLEKADAATKDAAMTILNDLEGKVKSGEVKDLTKVDGVSLTLVIAELKCDIDNPAGVETGYVGDMYYCGKASIQNQMIACNPVQYVNLMLELFNTGEYKVSDDLTLCIPTDFSGLNTEHYSSVDFIFGKTLWESTKDLATIRKYSKGLSNEGGTTPQEMKLLLGICGFDIKASNYYGQRPENAFDINILSYAIQDGYIPIILENHMITKTRNSAGNKNAGENISTRFLGIHYVPLYSLQTDTFGNVSGSFMEYGKIVQFGPMSQSDFLKGLQGFWIPEKR